MIIFSAQLLYKLGYIENYASGLNRILKEYENDEKKPQLEINPTNFKVTLPNRNYDALYLHPEKHIQDNKGNTGPKAGPVNGPLNGLVNDAEKNLSKRDANIYKTIKLYPGLRKNQLIEYLYALDPDINLNILKKRLSQMVDLIEFRGVPKTGGYYIKD